MAARHHVYDTQEQDRLCAFLDMLAMSEDQQLVAVHCIPDVGGPHWFVIWKQHKERSRGAIGFGLSGLTSQAVERRDGQTVTAANVSGSPETEIADGAIQAGFTTAANEEHEVVEGCLDCPHPDYCAGMGQCEIGAAKLAERSAATLDERRAAGLCSMCGELLTEKERGLEGLGGSYVRCDECVREIQRGDWLIAPGGPEA